MNETKATPTITSVLERIADLERRIPAAREEKQRADSVLSSLECELRNARTEFTKLVAPHLDRASLDRISLGDMARTPRTAGGAA